MPRREMFFVGISRNGQEIAAPGYVRKILALEFDEAAGMFSNVLSVTFEPALRPYGFINGLVLSGSVDGEAKAVCPLFFPLHVGSGVSAVFPPGTINMNLKSLEAIRGIRPIAVS
jgi:hypothetical protein